MTKRPRRNHSPAFKAKVAVAAIKGDKTLAKLVQLSTCTPTRLLSGARNFLTGFGRLGKAPTEAAPAVDVKALHAKIDEPTLENDFLCGALGKAGLLASARR